MAFIISAGTKVTGFLSTGIVSFSMQSQPQIQRLYALGSDTPFNEIIMLQKSVSISIYAPGPSRTLAPSHDCSTSNTVSIGITADACQPFSDSDDYVVQGYTYQKDVQSWGIETWQFVSPLVSADGEVATMIAGIAEGQTSDGGANTGINLVGAVSSVNGSSLGNIDIQAGSPGIGRALHMSFGVCNRIGGGTGKLDGVDGQGQVQIPVTPIFIGQ